MSKQKEKIEISPAAWGTIAVIGAAFITAVVGPIIVEKFKEEPAQVITATATSQLALATLPGSTPTSQLALATPPGSTPTSQLASATPMSSVPTVITAATQLPPPCTVLLRASFEAEWLANQYVQQRLGCPLQSEMIGPAWEQLFQRGLMYWSSADDYVYELYATTDSWSKYKNTYREGEHLPTLSPPQSLFPPDRAFNKVWQNEAKVQTELGWATRPEDEMIVPEHLGAYQPFQGGTMLYAWFVNGHGCQIYVLFDNDKTYVVIPDHRGSGC